MVLVAQKYSTKDCQLPHYDKPMARADKFALMVKPTYASSYEVNRSRYAQAQRRN